MKKEHFVAAVLSEMVYFPNSIALGHAGVAHREPMSESAKEQLRRDLFHGEPIGGPTIQALHKDFWRNELQQVLNTELQGQALDHAGRERLSTMLFCALFTTQSHPEGVEEQVARAQLRQDTSAKSALVGEGRFERPGLWRSDDIHAVSFTTLWEPEHGFDGTHPTVFVVHRGTENQANALKSGLNNFAAYGLHEYRNFAKSYLVNYSTVHQGYLQALQAQGCAPKAIISTGHSYGGAMAQELYLHHGTKMHAAAAHVECVTFGSPRSGPVGVVGVLNTTAAALGGLALHQAQKVLLRGNTPVDIPALRYRTDAKAQRAFEFRQTVGRILPAYISTVTLGAVSAIEHLAVRALNYLDARRTGAKGLDTWGYQHAHEPRSVSRARLDPSLMTHYAQERDFVPRVGEGMGFELLGKKYMIRSNQTAAGGFMDPHSMSGYTRALRQFCPAQSGYVQAYQGCAQLVEDLMARQWQNHLHAARTNTVVPFLQEQLQVGTTSAHEMAPYVRTAVQTVFERFVQPDPIVGSLTKCSRIKSLFLAPITFVKGLLPRQAQIHDALTDALVASAPFTAHKVGALARSSITASTLSAHVGGAKVHKHQAFIRLGTDAIADKLKLHPTGAGKMEIYWGARKAPEEFKHVLQAKAVDLYVQEHLDLSALNTPQLHPHAAGFAVKTALPLGIRSNSAAPVAPQTKARTMGYER